MPILTVSTAAELRAALSSAQGGDKILLAGGDYGDLNLTPRDRIDVTFASNVTIASADPGNPATFSAMDLRGGQNITFQDVTFDYTFKPDTPIYSRPFSVTGSENIQFRGCTFDGDVAAGVSLAADGYGYGIGLSVRNSSGLIVDSCEFRDFWKGATIGGNDIVFSNNNVHSMRMDGVNFGLVTNALIEGNKFHDFSGAPGSGDHRDMIQFWTNGFERPSSNITIRDNLLDIGSGSPSQSIFMRNDQVDRGLAGSEMYYQNILIEDNVIVNSHAHGITVGATNGLTIRNNSVLHADGNKPDGDDPTVNIPRINVSNEALNVTITQNMTGGLNGWQGQPGWTVGSNLIVQNQDPLGKGYYGDIFLASTLDRADNGLHEFRLVPGGFADRNGLGASETRDRDFVGLDTNFHVTQPEDVGLSTRVFNAGYSTLNGLRLPQGTVYEWTFSDGTHATGAVVRHTFPEGGVYEATLTVRLPSGKTGTADADVAVQDSTLVEMRADGRFVVTDDGVETVLAKAVGASSDGLQLGAPKVAASIGHTYIDDLFGADEFRVSLSLDADSSSAIGEVFRIHGSMIASVNKNGEFSIRLFSDTGTNTTLTSTGVKINDLAEHDIDIRLDNGIASLWIDGDMVSKTAFAGHLNDYGSRALAFGNAWGHQNFYGDLTAFEVSLDGGSDVVIATSIPEDDLSGILLAQTSPMGIIPLA